MELGLVHAGSTRGFLHCTFIYCGCWETRAFIASSSMRRYSYLQLLHFQACPHGSGSIVLGRFFPPLFHSLHQVHHRRTPCWTYRWTRVVRFATISATHTTTLRWFGPHGAKIQIASPNPRMWMAYFVSYRYIFSSSLLSYLFTHPAISPAIFRISIRHNSYSFILCSQYLIYTAFQSVKFSLSGSNPRPWAAQIRWWCFNRTPLPGPLNSIHFLHIHQLAWRMNSAYFSGRYNHTQSVRFGHSCILCPANPCLSTRRSALILSNHSSLCLLVVH